MAVGLANGSRSANKSIQADVFLSLIFGLLFAPFLLLFDSADAVEPCIFFRKSKAKIFDDDDDDDDDCADAIGLQPLAALLKMSNKQSVSLGSSFEMSNKSRMVESLTLALLPLVAFSGGSEMGCAVSSFTFFDGFFVEVSFCDAFTSSSKSSYKCYGKSQIESK